MEPFDMVKGRPFKLLWVLIAIVLAIEVAYFAFVYGLVMGVADILKSFGL